MNTFIIDIETIPRPTAELEKMMPPGMLNPVMPEEIADPPAPDWKVKCPEYGLPKAEKALADLKAAEPMEVGTEEQHAATMKKWNDKCNAALKALNDSEAKRESWITEAKAKFERGAQADRDKWRAARAEERARFVSDAALRADRGNVKIIGVSKYDEAGKLVVRSVFVWETDKEIREKLSAEFNKPEHVGVNFVRCFPLEWQIVEAMREMILEADGSFQVITFFGNTFDLPFVARRGAIMGKPAFFRFLSRHMRGRYLDSGLFLDVCEAWKMGDRETSYGGLEAVAALLGCPDVKSGEGATFYRWYLENPVEGVFYNIGDMKKTEWIARGIGAL